MGNSWTDWLFPKSTLRKLFPSLFKYDELRILLNGLGGAGKTSILYRWAERSLPSLSPRLPTIGFNAETFESSSMTTTATTATITAWDVGGRCRIRPLWRHYFANKDGLVFVVDSTDRDRLAEAKDYLHYFLKEEELKGVPLLIFCNKQDLPNALTPAEIIHHFFLQQAPSINRPFCAVGCSVINGTGLQEGLRWLTTQATLGRKTAATRNDDDGNAQKNSHPMKTAVEQRRNDDPDTTVTSSKTRQMPWRDDVIGYSPSDSRTNPVLQSFRPIQRGSPCPFAKAAKLWGVKVVVGENTTATNNNNNVAAAAAAINNSAAAEALAEFVRRSDNGEPLDGFCIELRGQAASTANPSEFGAHVYAALRALSDLDPSGERAMQVSYIGARGWRFRFAQADFFVTTFCPCYPSTSSRYAFGTGKAFLLLQPELSFLRHNLPDDTPVTLDPPKTIRDKTRLAFRDAGQGYSIPPTTKYPPAEHIVKPLYDDGFTIIHWWDQEDSALDSETKVAH